MPEKVNKDNDSNEYVDLLLEVKNGQVVGCEFYGEGRQVEPLTGPQLFLPIESTATMWPRSLERVARRINLALLKLEKKMK